MYDALTSGAGRWAPWSDLVAGLHAANAGFERVLGRARDDTPGGATTARTILVVNRKLPGDRIEPETFEAEPLWKGYALTQRLHLLDHRTQVRKLRVALNTRAHDTGYAPL